MSDRSMSTPRQHTSRSRGHRLDHHRPTRRGPTTPVELADESYRDATDAMLARLAPYGLVRVL